MRRLQPIPILLLSATTAVAQTVPALPPDSLIAQFRVINAAVAGPHPAAGKQLLLPNRAMNIFLSEAAGYYLSSPDDLTLYKNSVIANSSDGTVSIYHNARQPAGIDSGIRRFLSFGAQVNAADAFNASSAGRSYVNRFGFLIKHVWVGRPRVTATPYQIGAMDVLRANILHSAENEIHRRVADEEAALAAIDPVRDIPGQDPAEARAFARRQFNAALQQQMEFEWARAQADTLARTFFYKVISFHWTSISLYVPLITADFAVAPATGADPVNQHAYPLHLNLTHTRLWEGGTFGRIFLTLAGDLSLNNSRDAYMLTKSGDSYIGDYSRFFTPALTARAIYFPKDSHIGVSFLAQQSFGSYHACDATLGFPIVLINKRAEPAINFEFQVRFYDLGHTIAPGTGFSGHTAVGLTIGVPFSKIAF